MRDAFDPAVRSSVAFELGRVQFSVNDLGIVVFGDVADLVRGRMEQITGLV